MWTVCVDRSFTLSFIAGHIQNTSVPLEMFIDISSVHGLGMDVFKASLYAQTKIQATR